MKLNKKLLADFKNSESKLLAVTKYWSLDETNDILSQFSQEQSEILIGLGENRVHSLKEKNLEREATHFIGNIQTKEIKFITQFCSTIHSLDNIKQIRKIDNICEKQGNWIKVFIQINVDSNKDGGIKEEEIEDFIAAIDETTNVSLIGFSIIGKAECSEKERREEFNYIKNIRNKYLQKGVVSAGTSRDYKVAIEEGVDVVRVGKGLIIEE
ncbi:alanine racemase [Candidatus Gracilibacteria bacterium]|nr:alanine racemase [Candidatus Gracilibacteria bacterium]